MGFEINTSNEFIENSEGSIKIDGMLSDEEKQELQEAFNCECGEIQDETSGRLSEFVYRDILPNLDNSNLDISTQNLILALGDKHPYNPVNLGITVPNELEETLSTGGLDLSMERAVGDIESYISRELTLPDDSDITLSEHTRLLDSIGSLLQGRVNNMHKEVQDAIENNPHLSLQEARWIISANISSILSSFKHNHLLQVKQLLEFSSPERREIGVYQQMREYYTRAADFAGLEGEQREQYINGHIHSSTRLFIMGYESFKSVALSEDATEQQLTGAYNRLLGTGWLDIDYLPQGHREIDQDLTISLLSEEDEAIERSAMLWFMGGIAGHIAIEGGPAILASVVPGAGTAAGAIVGNFLGAGIDFADTFSNKETILEILKTAGVVPQEYHMEKTMIDNILAGLGLIPGVTLAVKTIKLGNLMRRFKVTGSEVLQSMNHALSIISTRRERGNLQNQLLDSLDESKEWGTREAIQRHIRESGLTIEQYPLVFSLIEIGVKVNSGDLKVLRGMNISQGQIGRISKLIDEGNLNNLEVFDLIDLELVNITDIEVEGFIILRNAGIRIDKTQIPQFRSLGLSIDDTRNITTLHRTIPDLNFRSFLDITENEELIKGIDIKSFSNLDIANISDLHINGFLIQKGNLDMYCGLTIEQKDTILAFKQMGLRPSYELVEGVKRGDITTGELVNFRQLTNHGIPSSELDLDAIKYFHYEDIEILRGKDLVHGNLIHIYNEWRQSLFRKDFSKGLAIMIDEGIDISGFGREYGIELFGSNVFDIGVLYKIGEFLDKTDINGSDISRILQDYGTDFLIESIEVSAGIGSVLTSKTIGNILLLKIGESRSPILNDEIILSFIQGGLSEDIFQLFKRNKNVFGNVGNDLIYVLDKFENSPSTELQKIGGGFIPKILEYENPRQLVDDISDIFVRNNLPRVGKIHRIIEVLYPQGRFQEFILSNGRNSTSPLLANMDNYERGMFLLYRDSLRNAIYSGDSNLRDYFLFLQRGKNLTREYQSGSHLSEIELGELTVFFDKIGQLLQELGITVEKGNSLDEYLENIFLATGKTSFDDVTGMLAQNLLNPVGIDSIDDALDVMGDVSRTVTERSIHFTKGVTHLGLEPGDVVHGASSNALRGILNGGFMSGDLLGANKVEDLVPFSHNLEEIQGSRIDELISGLGVSRTYGDIKFVTRDRGQFFHSNHDNYMQGLTRENRGKFERYYGGPHENQVLIRSGLPSSEIDFMIVEVSDFSRSGLQSIFFELARKDLYIPVVDNDGRILFTYEDFQKYRETFYGINQGVDSEIIGLIQNSEHSQGISRVIPTLDELEHIQGISLGVKNTVLDGLSDLGIQRHTSDYQNDISRAKMDDTGSTGRGTNLARDFDFDYSLQVSLSDMKRIGDIRDNITSKFNFDSIDVYEQGDGLQIRMFGVEYNGEKIDIDIFINRRPEVMNLEAHDGIMMKLNYIRDNYGEEKLREVIGNIRYAKEFFQELGVYKKGVGENGQGGLGGIGIETWILQNGGSFDIALESLSEGILHSENFLDFRDSYLILGAGDNIKTGGMENFTYNMTEEGYQILKEYFILEAS